jgi:hypothetical protein
VKALLAGVLLAGAVLVPLAAAAPGDPQKAYTKADQARAKAASLRLADLGTGWKATPTSKKDSNPRCSTYNPDQSDLVETGSYDSPNFERPDGSFVATTTGVFRTAGMARKGYARVAVPQLPGCFGELFARSFTKPNSAKILSTGALAFPRVGDRSNAYRLVASVTTPLATVPVTIDLVTFNKGRTDVALIMVGLLKAFPATFEQAAALRVLTRIHS